MALRIENAYGPDRNHLLRMQLAYDVAKTRKRIHPAAIIALPSWNNRNTAAWNFQACSSTMCSGIAGIGRSGR